jgi:hypothetical protein
MSSSNNTDECVVLILTSIKSNCWIKMKTLLLLLLLLATKNYDEEEKEIMQYFFSSEIFFMNTMTCK